MRNFAGFDYIVAPSGSCVHHVREHLDAIEQTAEVQRGPRAHLRAGRVPARRAEGRRVSLGRVPAPGRAAQQLRARCARCEHATTVRDRRAVVLQAAGPAVARSKGSSSSSRSGRTNAAASAAPSRSSRSRSRPRWATTRSATTRRPAPSTSSRADMSCLMHQQGCAERIGAADQVHPHRPDPERSPGMKPRRSRRGGVAVHRRRRTTSTFHDKRLWDLRKKRDRESAPHPRMGGAARARLGDQGAHAHAPRRLSRAVRAQCDRERHPRALGARRRRAQPDRPRHPARARREDAGQEQVDAHRGVRACGPSSRRAASR